MAKGRGGGSGRGERRVGGGVIARRHCGYVGEAVAPLRRRRRPIIVIEKK